MLNALRASLKRMGRDQIDLYQVSSDKNVVLPTDSVMVTKLHEIFSVITFQHKQ